MTDRDNEIRQRCDAATPGPWELLVRGNTVKSFAIEGVCGGMKYVDRSDAAFIAASRTDIPYLLDRVAELERENERLKAIEFDFAEWNAGKRGVEDYLELQCRYRDRLCDIDRMTKEIERLRDVQRWIPVAERLPTYMQSVLLCEGETVFSSVWDLRRDMHRVTHWQPLPEPPQEG